MGAVLGNQIKIKPKQNFVRIALQNDPIFLHGMYAISASEPA